MRERLPTEIRGTSLVLSNHKVATAPSRSRLRLGLANFCRSRFGVSYQSRDLERAVDANKSPLNSEAAEIRGLAEE